MWLIKQKLRDIDPPTTLKPEMVPPSLRKSGDLIMVSTSKILLYLRRTFLYYFNIILKYLQ